MLAVWTAEAPKFSAPDGLAMPANSSVFLTFVPLKAGTFEVGDDSRLGALRAFGTIAGPGAVTPLLGPVVTPLLEPVVTVPIDPAPTTALDPPAVGDDPGAP
jgi:hypothetical protein